MGASMNRQAIVLAAALGMAVSGCATNRLEKTKFGTANARFSVAKDLVIIRGNQGDRQNRDHQLAQHDLKHSAGNLVTLLHDYYAASALVRDLEFKTDEAWQMRGLEKPNLAARQDPDYEAALINYRSAGFDASRGVCRYALNLLGESHSDYKFLNKSGHLATGAGASLMGILEASARTTSLYAVGTSLYQAWAQSFEEYAYLTASIGTIGRKVTAAQDAYREGIEFGVPRAASPLPPRNWAEATVQIQRYNDFCLATGMRALVEEAVGKADVYFDPDRKDVEIMNTSAADMRRVVETVRQQQRVYRELGAQQDVIRRENKTLEEGRRARDDAKALVTQLSANPFYDSTARRVDIDAANRSRSSALTALRDEIEAGGPNIEILRRDYEQAAKLASDARRLEGALRAEERYNEAWEQGLTGAIARAEQRITAIDDQMKAAEAKEPAK